MSAKALEILEFNDTTASPDLFSLLRAYLRSPKPFSDQQGRGFCKEPCCCELCTDSIISQLETYAVLNTSLCIGTASAQVCGTLYQLHQGIVYFQPKNI